MQGFFPKVVNTNKKKYALDFLYDNGEKETFTSQPVTEEELMGFMNTFYTCYQNGIFGVTTLACDDGTQAVFNVQKVDRVTYKEIR